MNMLAINETNMEWEATLNELTRLARKFPSRQIYEQLAECYRNIGEHQEAKVILDLARSLPHNPTVMAGPA